MFFGKFDGFFDEGLNNLGFWHGFNHFAFDEDLAFTIAGGDPQVGVAGLAWAVHHAAHDGYAEWDVHAVECRGDFFSECVNVHLGPAAGGARYDFQSAFAQVEGLEDLVTDFYFFFGVGG